MHKKSVFFPGCIKIGKYKGKSFQWLLDNDMGYTIYLIKNLQQEEATGVLLTAPMKEVIDKEAIDNLLNKHHRKEDLLKLVDQEYAAMVHSSCTDPKSMLYPTTRLHIALGQTDDHQYFIKHKSRKTA
ncbi:uncharacterized protein LOC113642200, partial [Tachysurus ichikawai]